MKALKIYALALVFVSIAVFAADNESAGQMIATPKLPVIIKDGPYPWNQAPIWQTLDVGLYWVTNNNQYCPADQNQSARMPGCENAFNPNKPTVIFFHGWEPLSTRTQTRFDFYTSYYTGQGWQTRDIDLGKIWRDKGWNVGIFYWNQISDTTYPSQAAAKIWSTKTSQAMYWKKYNPNTSNSYYRVEDVDACQNRHSADCKPVGELAYEAYVNAMKDYQGNNIRLIGHSLGGQLVIDVTHKIAENVAAGKLSPHLLPRQMVLLDPFFTPSGNTYLNALGINNQMLADQYVDDIANQYGIAVSEFLSSDITAQQNWSTIENVAALTLYRPWFDPVYREDEKHSVSWQIYLSSFADKPPMSYSKPFNTYNLIQNTYAGISASTPIFKQQNNSYEGVAAAMEHQIYFDQNCLNKANCGEYSPDPALDGFLQYNTGHEAVADAIEVTDSAREQIVANSTRLLNLHDQVRFIATPLSANNNIKHIVLWQSSNNKIVTVFPGGYAQAVGTGTATIKAIVPGLGNEKPVEFSFMIQVV